MRDAFHRHLARLICRAPKLVLLCALLVAGASATIAVLNLKINANTDDLIGEHRPWMGPYRDFLAEFGDLEQLYAVIVDREKPGEAEAAALALQAKLSVALPETIVHAAISETEQRRASAHAMATDELRDLVRAREAIAWILSEEADPARVAARAEVALRRAADPRESEEARELAAAAAVFTAKLLAASQADTKSHEELKDLIEPRPAEFLKSDTGRLLFVEIAPPKDYGTLAVIEEPLRVIRRAIEELRSEYPGLEIGLTGKPVLQADEMVTTDADMTRAAIVAILLVGLSFMLIMREILRPALAVIALVIGIAWTFGFATLAVGQLNLLSVVFTLVLVGVGIDFGVHFVARYREALARGTPEEAVEEASVLAGRGNSTGALTSSVAFLATAFTDFQGLQELGLIAGGGIALCLLAMATVLPAAILFCDRRRRLSPVPPGSQKPWWPGRHPKAVAGIALGLLLLSLPNLGRQRFDENVLELQAPNLESVRWEHRILEDSAAASWFGALIADDRLTLDLWRTRAADLPAIGATRSIADFVPKDDAERIRLRAQLAQVAAEAAQLKPLDTTAPPLSESLDSLTARLRALAQLAVLVDPDAAGQLTQTAADLEEVGKRALAPEAFEATLAAARRRLNPAILGAALPLREALPAAIRDRFIAPSGRFLLAVHPKENVWDTTAMREFVSALRRIDPSATGVPITHLESINDMKQGFLRAALIAFAFVAVLVALDFRSLSRTLLALLPLLLSGAWLVAAMTALGLSFNLANFFAVPILIGIGVDAGIHLIHRHRESAGQPQVFGATQRAVLLTALTSLIGFGALVFAEHRGLASLGAIMALGCTALLLAALFVIPALLALFGERPKAEAARK